MESLNITVTLRDGTTAQVRRIHDDGRLWAIDGFRNQLRHGEHVREEHWRRDGCWACDGHEHAFDIVSGLPTGGGL